MQTLGPRDQHFFSMITCPYVSFLACNGEKGTLSCLVHCQTEIKQRVWKCPVESRNSVNVCGDLRRQFCKQGNSGNNGVGETFDMLRGANFLSASFISVWPTVHVLIMTESSLLGPARVGAHFGNLQVFKLSGSLEEWKGPFRADRDTTRTSYSWAPPLPQSFCCTWLLEQGDGKFRLGSHSLESSLPLGVQVMESSLTSVVHTTEQ